MENKLNFRPSTIWTGDNLSIMRGINSESMDLIYLDPPFNSKANYAAPIGSKAAGAEFKDIWTLDEVDIEWINLLSEKYANLHNIIKSSLTDSNKSYLCYMAVRLLEMKRLLKPTGSIFVHCDPTMSHWLKILMDCIFGIKNFRNEIIWHYQKMTTGSNIYQRQHDSILFYAFDGYTFNKQYSELTERQRQLIATGYNTGSFKGKKIVRIYDKNNQNVKKRMPEWENEGREIQMCDIPKGKAFSNVWQISMVNGMAKENVGYPTQKPLNLLEQIIIGSSNEGDMVFDPFCGCATTLVAADRLRRKWIGIDISSLAIKLVNDRIRDDRQDIGGLYSSVEKGKWRGAIARDDIPIRTDLGRLPPYRSHLKALYGEQEGNCAGCERHFESHDMVVDHIIAKAKGGTDHKENLQLLCHRCNNVKGERGMAYLKSKLRM